MARKISEKSLLGLAAAYARAYPAEVAAQLENADPGSAAQFLEAVDLNTAVDLLEESTDEHSATLLHQLSDDGFGRLVARVHRHRLEKLKTLDPVLAKRLKPADDQP